MEGRSEELNRRSAVSLCSSSEGEEPLNCYGPMSPTFKVSHQTKGGPYVNVFQIQIAFKCAVCFIFWNTSISKYGYQK